MVVDLAADEVTDRVFRALADATRRHILHRAAAADLSVSTLAAAYPLSFAAVQKHVAVLERAGLVTKQRRGRERLVRTDPDALARARRALDELEATWRGRVADFDAPRERAWQLWADPRQLEAWWGPPAYPATFEAFDLTPGGECTYFMTGPRSERYHGWWQVTSVDPPQGLALTDGFAHPDGTRNDDLPLTTTEVRLTEHGGHAHGAALHLRHPRADGPAHGDGHGRGPSRGRRPDGCPAGLLTARPPRHRPVVAGGRGLDVVARDVVDVRP